MFELYKLERRIAEKIGNFAVTPCMGVWIEISKSSKIKNASTCHSLRWNLTQDNKHPVELYLLYLV